MLRAMTRMVLGVLTIALLSACAGGVAGDDRDDASGGDTQAFKTEMDGVAADLLPDLHQSVGGQPAGLQAGFVERGGYGVWDYTARGTWTGPTGSAEEILDRAEAVLADHGFEVERPGRTSDLVAGKGDVRVSLERGLSTDVEQVGELRVTLHNADGLLSGDDYAERTPPVDYLSELDLPRG